MIEHYPTSKITQTTKVEPFEINVARNSEIKQGSWDLVIISLGEPI